MVSGHTPVSDKHIDIDCRTHYYTVISIYNFKKRLFAHPIVAMMSRAKVAQNNGMEWIV